MPVSTVTAGGEIGVDRGARKADSGGHRKGFPVAVAWARSSAAAARAIAPWRAPKPRPGTAAPLHAEDLRAGYRLTACRRGGGQTSSGQGRGCIAGSSMWLCVMGRGAVDLTGVGREKTWQSTGGEVFGRRRRSRRDARGAPERWSSWDHGEGGVPDDGPSV